MIEGQPWGKQPQFKPVAVPPINEILGRTIFGRGAIIPGLHLDDLERIRSEALERELNPDLVPYLKREPLNEQEVLAIVVADVVGQQKRLGIDEIIWARTRFPDMLVRIGGREVYLELEFDSLGFWDHIEKKQLRRNSDKRCNSKWEARVKDEEDDRPVAVLCWVDGDEDQDMRDRVRNLHVFSIQSLLREGRKIEL